MKRLLIKLLIFTFPIYTVLLFYFITDPFKVLYKYDAYYENNRPWGIVLNKDFVSVESFLQNRDKYHYDAYIFGNSRSMFYPAAVWRQYIGDSANVFHFDANSESLFGIYRKIKLIDSLHAPFKDALIVLDKEVLSWTENSAGHLFIKDYRLTAQSWLSFQLVFFKDFITSPKFITACLDYKLSRRIKPYMFADRMLSRTRVGYDARINEISFGNLEDSIVQHTQAYYSGKESIFYARSSQPVVSDAVIKTRALAQLTAIRDILKKNNTRYRIVISPLYDQKRLSPDDLNVLKQLFGQEQVFDFSGINPFTADKTNYYENAHYRPQVAREILRSIYE